MTNRKPAPEELTDPEFPSKEVIAARVAEQRRQEAALGLLTPEEEEEEAALVAAGEEVVREMLDCAALRDERADLLAALEAIVTECVDETRTSAQSIVAVAHIAEAAYQKATAVQA